MDFEQKYLKYKSKYLSLKHGGVNGGVLYDTLSYERVNMELPDDLGIGNIISFNGLLKFKDVSVGSTSIIYFIKDVATDKSQIVKISVLLILFDGSVYKFSNENVPITLQANKDKTLAPYNTDTVLKLDKSSNNEKDIQLKYVINNGNGTFTFTKV